MKLLDGIISSMDMSLSKLQEIMKDRETWHAVDHGVTKSQQELTTEQQPLRVQHFLFFQLVKKRKNRLKAKYFGFLSKKG